MSVPSLIFFTNIVPCYRSSFFESLATYSPVSVFRNGTDHSIGLSQVEKLDNVIFFDLKYFRILGVTFHFFPLKFLLYIFKKSKFIFYL